jgi:hypothetical protein
MEAQRKSAGNAHKMYLKTRAEASKRSVKRSKEMQIGLHSMFVSEHEAAQANKGEGVDGYVGFFYLLY